ncbi:MAG: hypothetical protein WBM99_11740 [Psychromonas sp.]
MDIKKQYISDLATFLSNQDKVMSAEELASHLNRNGFRTSYDSKYKGGLGTYKLIKSTWSDHYLAGEKIEADNVAAAFVKPSDAYK